MAITKIYQVFCNLPNQFRGNTSSVVILNGLLPDQKLQEIAADLCQPATTFLLPTDSPQKFKVRWFAPDAEIDICGHGAAAAIAYLGDRFNTDQVFELHHKSGFISGSRDETGTMQLNLPAYEVIRELPISTALTEGLGIEIVAHYETSNKNIVLVSSEEEIKNLEPKFEILRKDGHFGYIVTAPGISADFVSRTFVPHVGQLEDPATGSSHAALTPFWANKLSKNKLEAVQLSKRGGAFFCELRGDRSLLSGAYRMMLEGTLVVE